MGIYLTLWLYQKQFLEESLSTCAVTVLISIVLAVYTVFLIINLFRPVLFRVTRQGVLSGSVTDYVSIITSSLCLLLLFAVVLTSNMSRNRKLSFLCCIFAPAAFATLAVNPPAVRLYCLKQNRTL